MTMHTYPSKQMRLIVWWSCEDLTSFVGPIALFNYGLDFGAVVHSRRVLESVTSMLSLLTDPLSQPLLLVRSYFVSQYRSQEY
jgi:hypothetical protein